MKADIPKEQTIGYIVHEVARAFRRGFEDEARAHGLTLPQWRALGVIDQENAITQVALAGQIDTDPMTVSGILDRLEKRGLIERYPHPTDSRAKLSRLTAEGSELLRGARNLGRQLYATSIAGLDEDQIALIFNGLTRIRDNLSNLDQAAAGAKEVV